MTVYPKITPADVWEVMLMMAKGEIVYRPQNGVVSIMEAIKKYVLPKYMTPEQKKEARSKRYME